LVGHVEHRLHRQVVAEAEPRQPALLVEEIGDDFPYSPLRTRNQPCGGDAQSDRQTAAQRDQLGRGIEFGLDPVRSDGPDQQLDAVKRFEPGDLDEPRSLGDQFTELCSAGRNRDARPRRGQQHTHLVC
jgi:hypothetical protein